MNFNLPLRLRVTLILAIAVFFIIVLYLLKKRRLNLKYTLLWLLTGVVMLIFVIFPGIMQGIADLFGIQTVMNTLYLLLFAFVLILLMMLTSIVSKQTERIAELAQNNAFLEQRVRELESGQESCRGSGQKSGQESGNKSGQGETGGGIGESGQEAADEDKVSVKADAEPGKAENHSKNTAGQRTTGGFIGS